jgi:opacity protein-like surface antigen
MRCNCLIVALVGALSVTGASVASAQSDEGFVVGYADVGPTIGLGGIGDAGVAIGGRFEQGVKAIPSWRDGVLGIGVSIDWYHYDANFGFGTDYDFTYIPIAVTANYHVRLENRKIDPFVGAGLGYQRVSFDCDFSFCDDAADSGVYFVGHGGIRYFWRPNMALYADVGAGAATLNVGLMFKIK